MFREMLKYIGIEEKRLNFSWISAAEGTKFAEVAKEVINDVKALGPAQKLIKRKAEVE